MKKVYLFFLAFFFLSHYFYHSHAMEAQSINANPGPHKTPCGRLDINSVPVQMRPFVVSVTEPNYKSSMGIVMLAKQMGMTPTEFFNQVKSYRAKMFNMPPNEKSIQNSSSAELGGSSIGMAERKKQEDLKRAEAERKRQEDLKRAEAERKRQEDLKRAEAERKRQEDLKCAEAERKRQEDLKCAEAERKRQEDLKRAEAERKRQEELKRAEAERKRQEELKRAEAERKRQEELKRAEAERKKQEELKIQQIKEEELKREKERNRQKEMKEIASSLSYICELIKDRNQFMADFDLSKKQLSGADPYPRFLTIAEMIFTLRAESYDGYSTQALAKVKDEFETWTFNELQTDCVNTWMQTQPKEILYCYLEVLKDKKGDLSQD